MTANEYFYNHLILWVAIAVWIAGAVTITVFHRRKNITDTYFNRWNLILQVVTIMIGGMIFWQIAQSADEIQDSRYATANSWMLDLDKTFLDNAKIRPYFYQGKEIPLTNSDDYQPVMAMSEYTLDTFDSFINHRFPGTKAVQPAWENWMTFCFSNSPALRFYITNNADWYNTNGELWDKVWTNWNYHYTNGSAKN